MRPARSAFTLIEVVISVLVLTLGLISACGLILFGLHLMRSAHGKSMGLATAMTVLVDPSPLATDPSISPNGPITQGYLNGMWVKRTESDPTPLEGAGSRLTSVLVSVDVYEAENGECFASITRRIIRRTP